MRQYNCPKDSDLNLPVEIWSTDGVRRIDRAAIEDAGIPGYTLMQRAAQAALRLALESYPEARRWDIVCGGGNNGGDGYVIARHLHNRGADVRLIVAAPPDRLPDDARTNHDIVRRMGLPVIPFASPGDADAAAEQFETAGVIVDAILGTGFHGDVRAPLAGLIGRINGFGRPVVAIDIPSGLDCDSGAPSNATIRAESTVTFVARKAGFAAVGAAAFTGRIHVVDIGAPRALIDRVRNSAC